MKKVKKRNSPNYVLEIFIGLGLVLGGSHSLITDSPLYFRDGASPSWGAWILTPMGFYILLITGKALWRNKQETKREAEAATLEEKDCETQVDVASGTAESESKKDEPPQGGV